jgi:hypothetical protein
VCNDRGAAQAVVDALDSPGDAVRASRLARFHHRAVLGSAELTASPRHASARAALASLDRAPELDLHDDNPA